ncbi:RNA-binding protein [Romeria aff. gracilis LEGE 07310]|uniref:RNA-binding protein n=1 Tax=Vasconcelosia minhoensis LEGE 07310 TaxID=915328 RepID=A0A8J7AYI9_9CYAN|nr:R3H domain-containing nucleic acid-binding protein [Romeria gracilis]MBE9078627.1 RNA-binding protein [Romeria aff. gracilis LEGE 07310]
MDEQTERSGERWLEQMLTLQGISAQVSGERIEDDLSDGSTWLTIDQGQLSPSQREALIGEKGSVLDSIQYLANTILNMGLSGEGQQAYTVELAGYRQRRQAELKAIAEDAAEQARTTQQEHEIRGLSSAERRQVHSFLSAHDGLETFSRGREPDRRLVVRLVGLEAADLGSTQA